MFLELSFLWAWLIRRRFFWPIVDFNTSCVVYCFHSRCNTLYFFSVETLLSVVATLELPQLNARQAIRKIVILVFIVYIILM